MRALNDLERGIILAFAERMESKAANGLMEDLNLASVRETRSNEECIIFELRGYERPPYRGQHSYPVHADLMDGDGAQIDVILYADANNRLFELEFIRWEDGDLVGLRLETLSFY